MQLLRDNLTLWTSDNAEQENDETDKWALGVWKYKIEKN
jgi:hypothetical protein